MLSFIASIFIFIIVTIFILLLIGMSVIRSIFFRGRRNSPTNSNDYEQPTQPDIKKKIFEDNEGEYTDYEEIE